jgi:hypothetical protein
MVRSKHALYAVAAVLILSLVGCGDNDDSASKSDKKKSASPSSTQSAGKRELAKALFTVKDLPKGYKINPKPEEDNSKVLSTTNQKCSNYFVNNDEKFGNIKAESEINQEFTGPGIDFISQRIGRFSNETVIDSEMTKLQQLIGQCSNWSQEDSDGTSTTYSLSELSLPSQGDDSVSVALVVTDNNTGDRVEASLTVIRVGKYATAFGNFDDAGVNKSEIANLAEIAADKLADIGN